MSIVLGVIAGVVTFDALVVAVLWCTGPCRDSYEYEGSE